MNNFNIIKEKFFFFNIQKLFQKNKLKLFKILILFYYLELNLLK